MVQNAKSIKKTSRDVQAEERRQQILDIARRLFAEKGYHATSMRELNKEIGMAEALTYHYFPGGKLEILRSVLQDAQERRMSNVVTSFTDSFQEDIPLKQLILNAVHRVDNRLMNDKEYFLILLREKSLLEQEQIGWLNEMAQLPTKALADFLNKRAEQGHIRQMDFSMAASQFISHIASGSFQKILLGTERDPEYVERLADYYVDMWSK